MSNDYFDTYDEPVADTLIRSAALIAIIAAIVAGFDKLPPLAAVREDRVSYCACTGAAGVYVATSTPSITSYTAGLRILFIASATNTGASTINLNTIGAKAIKRPDGSATVAGDILSGALTLIGYDGTNFQLLSSSLADATAAAASAVTASTGATTATTQAAAAVVSAAAAAASAAAAATSTTKATTLIVTDPNGAALTTGDGKLYYPIGPELNGYNLISPGASVSTVSSSGLPTIQLRRVRAGASADMLSTKITIDANEVDSATAVTPPVVDTANDDLQTGDQIHIDIDVAGTGAKGLVVRLRFS